MVQSTRHHYSDHEPACHYEIKMSHRCYHYSNTPVQYTAIFHDCKNVHFQVNCFNIFLIFAQNIDLGYTLEPPD